MNRATYRLPPTRRRWVFPLAILLSACLVASASAEPLQVYPLSADLGTIKVGARKTTEVQVTNTGTEAIEVEVTVDGRLFTVSPGTVRLAPGEKRPVAVSFSAATPGTYQAELLLALKGFLATQEVSVSLKAAVTAVSVILVPDPAEGLALGSVAAGDTAKQSVLVSNAGEVPVVIDSVTLAAEDGAFAVQVPARSEVRPGDRLTIAVRFSPPTGERYENRLVIHSADLNPSRQEYALTGDGRVPDAVFSPLTDVGLTFGEVALGETRTLELTVLNRGQADLRIAEVEITSGAFATTWDPTTAAPTRPGQRQTIPIAFHPTYEGRASGRLIVHSNDPEQGVAEIPLLGTARGNPPQVEVLSEERMEFGNVTVGKQERDQLLLWNRGGLPYTVVLDLEGEAAEDYLLESPSVVVQPAEVRKVPIRFKPRQKGDRRAELVVTTESGTRRIGLRGIGKFLELSPLSVDFDRVVVGKTGTVQTEIRNLGNADFTVTSVISTNPIFTAKSPVSASSRYVLQADTLKSLPISLGFTPPGRGAFSGVLQLQGYWDDALETRELLLGGTGIAADLELYPAGPYEFDYVVLGQELAQSVVATNTGDTDLKVEAHAESPEFRVEPAEASLAPGQAATLKLIFTPRGLGSRSGTIRLISNDVRERALALQVRGKGALDNVDLARVVSVLGSRKGKADTLEVAWTNTPLVVADETKVDVVLNVPEALRPALVGRRFDVEWIQLDNNYDEQGGPQKTEVQILDAGEERVLAEKLSLRLVEAGTRRVRLKVSTQNYPGAPAYGITQILEAGGWKWEFEAKPLVSFLSIRPSRTYVDDKGDTVKGDTERLVGLPGFAFFGYHNAENPSISGVHLTATGNVLEALSTENSIAVSLGVSLSFYKDRFMFGVGWDVYDHRPKARRRGTADYITTFKYWGLF
ncbi:MAG: choice-of-anchor D domain-containing protein [Candidatus Latescibacterota bacterium]